jgi:hypothetical protein
MTTATLSEPTERTKLQDIKATIAQTEALWVERWDIGKGEEEIIGIVQAQDHFGDWRSDEPGPCSPTPEQIEQGVSAALGFAVKLAELDGGVEEEEGGRIIFHFERGEAKPAKANAPEDNPAEETLNPRPEDLPPEPSKPAEPSETDQLREEIYRLQKQIADFVRGDKARKRRGQRIIEQRSIVEQDKKRLASSKNALEELLLNWVNEEVQEQPLWDHVEKQTSTANGSSAPQANGTPKAGENIHGPIHADPTTDDSWKSVRLDEALSVRAIGKEHGLTEAILKKLDDADLHTMGDLVRYQEAKGREHHAAPLATIKGIKGGTIEKIDNACQEFWRRRGVTRETAAEVVEKVAAATEMPAADAKAAEAEKPAEPSPEAKEGDKPAEVPVTDIDQVEDKPKKKAKGGKRKKG